MAKLLLLLAIVVVVALLVRKLLRAAKGPAQDAPPERPADPPAPEAKLVRCVDCGAFVPRADALPAPNGFRCGAGCNR